MQVMIKKQQGFTLIELAIVLVIIGLLLGGVLKGQELINSAKVKNFANDFRNVPVYIYGYQDKFKALPGDDLAAVAHVNAAATEKGNGNGKIDGAWNSTTTTDESVLFWLHVRKAGLAPGATNTTDGSFYPTNSEGGRMGVSSIVPITNLSGQYFMCSKGIAGKFAKQLDTTMDNGTSDGGSMQALDESTSGSTTAATSFNDSNVYTVCMGF